MPVVTRREMRDRVRELESENEELQSRLDEISDIVGSGEESEEEEEEQGND